MKVFLNTMPEVQGPRVFVGITTVNCHFTERVRHQSANREETKFHRFCLLSNLFESRLPHI